MTIGFDGPQPDDVRIELQRLLADPSPDDSQPRRALPGTDAPAPAVTLDDRIAAEMLALLDAGGAAAGEYRIRNTDRTVGARLAGEIARRHGDRGLPGGAITVRLHGSAGQSLGAFCIDGLQLELFGEANDYVGKSMAGGCVILRLPDGARYASNENFIAGNTLLYGATGGRLYAAGRAGERFAVRNSGALAVVEGVGDHGCEYMTGGCVVVLGSAGRNFAAGMTGGAAYVLDVDGSLPRRLNTEMVAMSELAGAADEELVRSIVQDHAGATGSAWAASILAQWAERRMQFWQVKPKTPGG